MKPGKCLDCGGPTVDGMAGSEHYKPHACPPDAAAHMPALISSTFGVSRSEARRAIAQGGVRVDGDVLGPDEQDVDKARLNGRVLRLGRDRRAVLRFQ